MRSSQREGRGWRELADLKGLMKEAQARREAEERAAQLARQQAEARQREQALFLHTLRETLGTVTPLAPTGLAQIERARPAPEPLQRELDDRQVMRASLSDEFDPESLMETDDQLSFRRLELGPDVLKKLRLGRWTVQGQIDLHGLTRDHAREALAGFLVDAGKRGWRCVRVVHGKGLGSPGREPVLKGKVRSWLVQRQEVLAFTQARGPDGGAGALIVLLAGTVNRPRAQRRRAEAAAREGE
ncbi:Smr/MutS family protein [Leptothrix discophora]|uniref:Smr/MutS family protein n=1 Tax=Leptothrix discophora TaxID=89 RepID=A0ABT9G420_LEPDI|nr:Smr/MutS family protein [Leptothrix discophora]MDP4300933.1 Smr/MutS family protein [Leptothrix discophora]